MRTQNRDLDKSKFLVDFSSTLPYEVTASLLKSVEFALEVGAYAFKKNPKIIENTCLIIDEK